MRTYPNPKVAGGKQILSLKENQGQGRIYDNSCDFSEDLEFGSKKRSLIDTTQEQIIFLLIDIFFSTLLTQSLLAICILMVNLHMQGRNDHRHERLAPRPGLVSKKPQHKSSSPRLRNFTTAKRYLVLPMMFHRVMIVVQIVGINQH